MANGRGQRIASFRLGQSGLGGRLSVAVCALVLAGSFGAGSASAATTWHLLDPNGSPVAGAKVTFDSGPTVVTAADGSFSTDITPTSGSDTSSDVYTINYGQSSVAGYPFAWQISQPFSSAEVASDTIQLPAPYLATVNTTNHSTPVQGSSVLAAVSSSIRSGRYTNSSSSFCSRGTTDASGSVVVPLLAVYPILGESIQNIGVMPPAGSGLYGQSGKLSDVSSNETLSFDLSNPSVNNVTTCSLDGSGITTGSTGSTGTTGSTSPTGSTGSTGTTGPVTSNSPTFRLLDANGNPVAGVAVAAGGQPSGAPYAVTAADGSFPVNGPVTSGTAEFTFYYGSSSVPGYPRQWIISTGPTAAETAANVIHLPQAYTAQFVTTNGASPVAGSTIVAARYLAGTNGNGHTYYMATFCDSGVTDASGSLTLPVLPAQNEVGESVQDIGVQPPAGSGLSPSEGRLGGISGNVGPLAFDLSQPGVDNGPTACSYPANGPATGSTGSSGSTGSTGTTGPTGTTGGTGPVTSNATTWHLLDASGNPVPGAAITFGGQTSISGGDGTFSVNGTVTSGISEFSINYSQSAVPGYPSEWIVDEGTNDAQTTANTLVLPPAYTGSFKTVNGSTPVSGATVLVNRGLTGVDGNGHATQRVEYCGSATTDGSGLATLPLLPGSGEIGESSQSIGVTPPGGSGLSPAESQLGAVVGNRTLQTFDLSQTGVDNVAGCNIPAYGGSSGGSSGSGSGSGGPTAPYVKLVLQDNPFGYWRLGDAIGATSMADYQGNYPGTFVNGAGGSPQLGMTGDGSTVSYFVGNDQYGYVNNMPAPQHAYSMEAWVVPFEQDGGMIMQQGAAGALYINAEGQYVFVPNVNDSHTQIVDTDPADAVPATGATRFHQVVGTWDGHTAILYVDGRQVGSATETLAPSGDATFYVGYGTLGPWFHGYIDEVSYYDHVLTPDRIEAHYVADPPPPLLKPNQVANTAKLQAKALKILAREHATLQGTKHATKRTKTKAHKRTVRRRAHRRVHHR